MLVKSNQAYVFIFLMALSWSCLSSEKIPDSGSSSKTLTSTELLILATDEDDLEAQYKIGQRYENGQGVFQSIKEALYWYRTAAKRGHVDAQFRLGLLYATYADSLREKGNIEKSKEMYSEAIDWLIDAAEEGHSKAQTKMGEMYSYGWGVEASEEEAIKWFRKSAEQGDYLGVSSLARRYRTGSGVEQNMQEAVRLYHEAAELGDPESMHDVGILYYSGTGVEKDINKALEWFYKASKNGSEKSYIVMATILDREDLSANEIEKIVNVISIARENSVPGGVYAAGYMYGKGVGVEKDLDEAFVLYLEAAEMKYDGAFALFSSLYLGGYHLEKYTIRIEELLKSEAFSGNGEAYCGLGKFYTRGLYVSIDRELGYVWLSKCVEAGHSIYQQDLTKTIERMSPQQLQKAKALALLY